MVTLKHTTGPPGEVVSTVRTTSPGFTIASTITGAEGIPVQVEGGEGNWSRKRRRGDKGGRKGEEGMRKKQEGKEENRGEQGMEFVDERNQQKRETKGKYLINITYIHTYTHTHTHTHHKGNQHS